MTRRSSSPASQDACRAVASAVAFPYDTGPLPQIVTHVQSASRLLAAYATERSRRCPTERMVLVGQSEGAAIIHLALPSVGSRLAAAVLLGDPARLAGARYDNLASANNGILVWLLMSGPGNLGQPVRDVLQPTGTARSPSRQPSSSHLVSRR